MTDYLPEVYRQFERRYPAVKEAFDALGVAEHDAGPGSLGRRSVMKDIRWFYSAVGSGCCLEEIEQYRGVCFA